MAIARDAAVAAGISGVSPVTFAHTCTGSNLMLFVYVWINQNTDSITGVTYNGVAMTAVNSGITDGTSDFGKMFYLVNPATGSHNVSISFTSGAISAIAASYTGVSQVAPEANNTNSANPGSSLTNTLTTIANNAWMASGISSDAGNSFTAGSGASEFLQDTAKNISFFDSNSGLSPGSNSMTVTCTSQRIQSVFCSFAPAGGAVATVRRDRMTRFIGA